MPTDTKILCGIEGLAHGSAVKGEPGIGFEKRARKAPLSVTVVKVNSKE